MNKLSLVWSPLTYLLTYLLLLEKLTGSQPVKKFPAFYGTRRFITAFTSACHLSKSHPIPFFILDISQRGHKTRPGHCNMQHWRFSSDWSCMCVSWSLSYSTLFQTDLLPHRQSLCSTCASALCFWVPLWGAWEHEALVWVEYKLWRWGNNLQCGV
jgi:hypothetical protein